MKCFLKNCIKVILFFFFLTFISFVIIRLAPGDPVMDILSSQDVALSVEDIQDTKKELGLDKPILIQYFTWLKRIFHFDLGISVITKKPVVDELFKAFPATLTLSLCSILAMLLIAIPLGIISAYCHSKIINKIIEFINLIGMSIPGFWLAFILVDIFCVKLNLLPSMGANNYLNLILPSVTLGFSMAPPYTKMLKSSLLENMNKDFVRSARSKGLCEKHILLFHILPNCLTSILTLFGMSLGSLLGGTVIIEVIFAYPGLGKLAIDAIGKRDYCLIQGFILFIGILVFIVNKCTDIICRLLNPASRLKELEQLET